MGDYKKNPKQPHVVKVPNKIRKRIKIAKELDGISSPAPAKQVVKMTPTQEGKRTKWYQKLWEMTRRAIKMMGKG